MANIILKLDVAPTIVTDFFGGVVSVRGGGSEIYILYILFLEDLLL